LWYAYCNCNQYTDKHTDRDCDSNTDVYSNGNADSDGYL